MRSKLLHLKEKAILLRRQGHSYGYIKKTLGLKSKGTISVWLRDIVLSKESRKKLSKNNTLATTRGLFTFNKNRTDRIRVENETAQILGIKSIPSRLTRRDLLLVGVSLYWAEGTKHFKGKTHPQFSFSNSDAAMVKVCMRFLREIFKIKEDKLRGSIHLYPDTDIEKSKEFWSNVTGLPKEIFYIITQVSQGSKGVIEKRLTYGTVHIRVTNRLTFFKMKGLIDGLIANLALH